MSELTDDQLDGLFRKSAEEFDPPFDPAAWQDMKTRLDTHDGNPVGGFIWTNLFRWGGLLVLLLLLTVGGWYAYYKVEQPAAKAKASPIKKIVEQPAQPQIAGKGQREESRLATAESARTTIADSPELLADKKEKPAVLAEPATGDKPSDERSNKPVSRAKESEPALTASATNRNEPAYEAKTGESRAMASRFTASGTAAAKRATINRRSDQLEVSSLSTQKQSRDSRKRKKMALSESSFLMPMVASVTKQPQETGQIANLATTESLPASGVEQTEPVQLPTLTELQIRPAHWATLPALAARPVVQPDTVAHRVVPKSDAMRGLSVRFVVAPDLSSVGLKNFSRPGTNVGLLLEYRLASRWSVQAGVIKSTKVYKAQTADYGYVPAYLLNQHAKLERIDGRCNMLDIPINVRYDVSLRPRLNGLTPSRWFINGGVTTYIMNQEDYTYKYLNNANIYPDTPTEWSTSTGNFGFSNLNLSAGYERSLNRRLSWQIEPFMKVPIRRVGYFNINLLSTGVFFSIRYKL